MPLQVTSGAASYDAFGGGVAVVPNYIEDVFSTWLYTGTGAAQTITNNIDLSTKGGLVWLKERNNARSHFLQDSARTITSYLSSDNTDAASSGTAVTALNTTGFTLGTQSGSNGSGNTYASWTFRKQPKFFDIVTYTGNGAASRNISHALGSKPGFVVLKRTDSTGNWFVAAWTGTTFRIGTDASPFALNSTNGFNTQNGAAATSTTFDPNEVTLSSNYGVTPSNANINGATYIAYLFAHDAGGFGLTGTDNVISCGGFTANGNNTITLGYEPQWVMVRRVSSAANDWEIYDTMRGCSLTGSRILVANTSGAEGVGGTIYPTATGFYISSFGSGDIIYIAIRRGPMKVPTTGTSVFQPVTYTGNGTSQSVTTGITGDLTYIKYRTDAGAATFFTDRLRGSTQILESNSTVAEDTSAQHLKSFNQLGFSVGNNGNVNASGGTFISETFKRAPSVFDIVCYTGTGVANRQITHNLTVAPELIICKSRSSGTNEWRVLSTALSQVSKLNGTTAFSTTNLALYFGNDTSYVAPTSSVFTVGSAGDTNANTLTYVAYLFATCAGVSKVGSYTGTATTKQIDCGFTAGARFVLIKRTDSTGDWYVWDTARGIVSGNDSYLLLNSTAAEVTNTDYIDTYSAGFEISSTAPAAINANGGSFIFFAVA